MTSSLLVVLLLIAMPARAASDSQRVDVDSAARAIYNDFMSPYCPGLLLADCRSEAATELRREIRTQLAAGVPERNIRDRLEAHFGEKLLAAPHARGLGLVAWLVPFAAIGLGLVGMLLWLRTQRPRPAPHLPSADAINPALWARLEHELRAFDGEGDAVAPQPRPSTPIGS